MRRRVCIYTAIYGAYDDLKVQPEQTVDCDFICFTDDPTLSSPNWLVIHLKNWIEGSSQARLQSKYPKILSHHFFAAPSLNPLTLVSYCVRHIRPYDYTIWIDGSVQIKQKTFAEEAISHVGDYGLAMFIHPERACVYDEANACLEYAKCESQPLLEQVGHYRRSGYPPDNGLMATGMIVRDARKKMLHKVDEDWWVETVKYITRDQVSLPYVLWKNGYDYDKINLNLWENDLFEVMPHNPHL